MEERCIEMIISIKEATKNDYRKLREIFYNTRLETFKYIALSSIKLEDFDSSTEGELILTAWIDGEIAGFISIWEEDKFIHNLFVSSEYKRCGMGKALINECINIIGLPLTLKCVIENKNALDFYMYQGWKIEEKVIGDESYYLMKLHKK